MRPSTRSFWRWIIALFFTIAGANHFLNPGPYLTMIPAFLPAPGALVWVSGLAEILGGLGILLPPVRRFSAWGLIALLIAVFPANLNVALHGWPGVSLPQCSLWLRLPFQFVFIWWVYRICLSQDRHGPDGREAEDQKNAGN